MDGGKTLHITERDKEIFEHLLQAKVLTGRQLLTTYFNGSITGYRRLTLLCSAGYLRKEPYFEKLKSGRKRKVGNTYRLTQKGVDELRQYGLVEAKRPLQRIPKNEDLDFHIKLHNVLGGLNGTKSAPEAKKELHLQTFIPLYAVAGDLHVFRVKSPYRSHTISAILNIADKLPRSVVLCATASARTALREKHRLGRVYALLERDIDLIPCLVSDPMYYLRLLLNIVKRKDPRISHPELTGHYHYIEVTVPEGTILIADTITGCLSTFRKIKNFEGDFYFVLAKDKKSVSGLPFKNRPVNVFLPDGTMFIADNTQPEAEGALIS